MGRAAFYWTALACIAALFVAVNVLAAHALKGARIDLTENRLYALSPGTIETLRALDEPIEATFFYSRTLAQEFPAIRAYGARVRELLEAYAARSGGDFQLTIVDPAPFSEDEDAAIAAGLDGAPTQSGETLYFGLAAANALDERAVIGFFAPEREAFLEYELTRLITELDAPQRRSVALITSLPLETAGPRDASGMATPQGLYAYEQLIAAFDVEVMDQEFTELPETADVVVIAHPWALTPPQLYAIDQFILEKGRALVFLDPLAQLALRPGPGGFPALGAERSSDLGPLLPTWGVGYDPEVVVLDRANALRAAVREDGRLVERAYPLWYVAPPAGMNADDLAVAPLERGLNLAAAGALTIDPAATATITPLITADGGAALADAADAAGSPDPADLAALYTPAGDAPVLGVRIAGRLTTAFPDGAPTEDGDADPAAAGTGLTDGEAQILLIADADLWDDGFYVRNDPIFGASTLADNAAFILNAVDLLTGSDALVSLRSRRGSDRPMSRVDDLRADAEARFFAEEARLEAELQEAETRLRELRDAGRGSGFFAGDVTAEISGDEQAEIERFRDVVAQTRSRLRDVQRSFRADIDRLAAWLTFVNVWLAPLMVAGVGVWTAFARRRAARRAVGAGS